MSIDKEEYIESSISLEGKYPRFLLDGDEKQDVLVRFDSEADSEVVVANSAEEDIGCELQIHLSPTSGKLSALRFIGAAKKWKLERVSVRFEEERDLLYMRLRWFLRQEMSLEVEELDDHLVLDLDKKDRLIGFAVTNASEHFTPQMLQDMASGSEWIKLVSYSDEFSSIEAVKAAMKQKKQRKKALAAEAARAVATPSPALSLPSSSNVSRDSSRNASPSRPQSTQTPRKRRVYTGSKINLIPQDGIAATTNTADESQRTYFTNRFVRDLEWVLNFPFIMREKSLVTSSGSVVPPASAPSSQSGTGEDAPLPLVSSTWVDFGKPTYDWLAELDQNPELYLPWIRERATRSNNLGGYFTMLIEFLLSRSIKAQEVLPKYQMFSGDKRTVGDLDFLMRLKAPTPENPDYELWTHWEVGIKFYLLLEGETAETGSSVFVGPHCTGDSLEKYVSKTVRQLELCKVSHVAEKLASEGKLPSQSKFFLKGYVFCPLTSTYYEREQEASSSRDVHYSGNEADPYPVDYFTEPSGWLYARHALHVAGLNGGPVCGWWVKYHHRFPYTEDGEGADMTDENLELLRDDRSLEEDILMLDSPPLTLAKAETLQHSMWTILNKMDYMAPILVTPNRPDIQLLNYASLKRTVKMCFATNYRSLFVAEVIPYARSQYKDAPNPLRVTHVEASRGFIVGEHWPNPPPGMTL